MECFHVGKKYQWELYGYRILTLRLWKEMLLVMAWLVFQELLAQWSSHQIVVESTGGDDVYDGMEAY